MRAQFGGFFPFLIKVINIHNSCTNVIPKMGMHLGVIGLHPFAFFPICESVFHSKTQFFGLMGFCIAHLVANPTLGLQ
jgi:hypothetical protein